MKKYRTLKNHQCYIPGLTFENSRKNDDRFYLVKNGIRELDISASPEVIDHWISTRTIEEIQKPIWTDSDLVDYAQFVHENKENYYLGEMLHHFKESKKSKG